MSVVKIYGIKCPLAHSIKYIGATKKKLSERLAGHICISRYKNRNSKKDIWLKSIAAIGLIPEIKLIEIVDESVWESKEKEWILFCRQVGFELTNSSDGGMGALGVPMTENARKIQSEQKKGKKRVKYNLKKPIVYSAETISLRKKALNEKYLSGQIKPLKNSKSLTREIVQYSLNGDFIQEFPLCSEASKVLGIKRRSITENLRGVNKSAYGFVFKYKYPKS